MRRPHLLVLLLLTFLAWPTWVRGEADLHRRFTESDDLLRQLAKNPSTLLTTSFATPSTPRISPDPDGIIGWEDVVQLFRLLATRPDITHRFPADGCYARTHLMILHLRALGLAPYKIWAFANGEDLYARTPNHPRGYVTWSYHVAPAIRARQANGEVVWAILDPALFHGPVSVALWESALRRDATSPRPFITLALPNQPPMRPAQGRAPGNGYWPAEDPSEGFDQHAVAMMQKFKPYEGRMPPAGWPGGPELPKATVVVTPNPVTTPAPTTPSASEANSAPRRRPFGWLFGRRP